jgi:hypothetical protein
MRNLLTGPHGSSDGGFIVIAAIYPRKSTNQNVPNEEQSVTRHLERDGERP